MTRLILALLLVAGLPATAITAHAQGIPAKEFDPSKQATTKSNVDRPQDGEYRLNHGDVLEISVRGFPELRQKATIELDGEITLPLAGRVRVVGLPLAAAQSVIKNMATQRPLQQRSADGRENYVALSLDDVLVTIAEYRPIYVMGDISRPGEVPFRPGMTARQAIALGGGYDIMRYRLVNPFLESADLKGQYEVLWTDAARARVRLKRIEIELDGKLELDPAILSDVPLEKTYLTEIVKTETETLKRRQIDHQKELTHINGQIEQNVAKVDNLRKQLDAETQGNDIDTKELEQFKDYQRRGSLPLMRLMELRRIQLTNSTRVLQTRVQFDQAERDLAEARRNLERHLNTYRTMLLAERQEQLSVYNGLMARIEAAWEKLEHTSILKSRLVRGRGGKVQIAIYRSLLDLRQTLVGNEDSALFPGDTIEISLESDSDANAALRGRGDTRLPTIVPKPSALPSVPATLRATPQSN